MQYEIVAPCHFGLEAVLKREIKDLGYDILKVEDGRVYFSADEEGIARANIFLRTCERILLKVGEFRAETFDELFEAVKALPWENIIDKEGRFWVKKAASVNSKLFSPSDIQRIVKKAIVERLKGVYHINWFPETGREYPLRVLINKNTVLVAADTTGESLHKRGYRPRSSQAPISETLAAALIMLTPWKKDRHLVDPFCGSGTIPIEAAMMAANIAPGASRSFLSNEWDHIINKKIWYRVIDEAISLENRDIDCDIQGYDIDGDVIKIARDNAGSAGVKELIHFQQRPVARLSHPNAYGFIITNPPYGERIENEKTLPELYAAFGERFRLLETWSAYIISAYEDTERYFGKKAAKNRKIYNGMIKTYYYQFPGPKPR